jgi:hypothetical protein
MAAFIDDYRAADGVEPICAVLPIAPSTYDTATVRADDPARLPPRAPRDATLREEIRRVCLVHRARVVLRQCMISSLSSAVPERGHDGEVEREPAHNGRHRKWRLQWAKTR